MLSQVNIYLFANEVLFVGQQRDVGILLGVLTIGIGCGAVLAGIWSRGKIELGLVPLGAAGIAVTSMLLATVPGGSPGHPAVAGYYWTGFWLLALGMTAGLYDIPLQAFLQDRSPPESRGSIMAAYNFLTFAGMLAASGLFWVLSSPSVFGLSARTIFLLGGLVTLPATFCIVRLLPFHTARLAVQLLTGCMYRVRVEGLENVPANGGALVVANHVSWVDGVLLGLACPRHPRMVAFAQYFDNRWLGWFGRLGRIIPIGTTPQVDGRVDSPGPGGFTEWRVGVHLPRRRHQPQRAIAGVPARVSVDTERHERSCGACQFGRFVGEHF